MKPYGSIDPNSQHQLWSRWEFRVSSPKSVPLDDVRDNAARWLRKGFGSVGRARVTRRIEDGSLVTLIEAEVEGIPAHDPGYVQSVRNGFAKFAAAGWGVTADASVKVRILAGDQQDGRPAAKLVVMPQPKGAV